MASYPALRLGRAPSLALYPITPHFLTTASLCRKINTSSSQVEDKEILTKHLTEPPVKRIDLVTSLGMKITARNLKGVTIKDALEAIHKANKKRVRIPCVFILPPARHRADQHAISVRR